MAEWQYTNPANIRPLVPTNEGYYNAAPYDRRRRYTPTPENATAVLIDQDNTPMPMYLHQIEASFEIGGSYAQSMRFREWYPKNFIQPMFKLTGQSSNQSDYADIVEFINQGQRKSLRWWQESEIQNSMRLIILPGGIGRHLRQGHSLTGHVKKIVRTAQRFVNAPEYEFEFLVTTADTGLFHIETTEGSTTEAQIVMAMQMLSLIRRRAVVSLAVDPDLKANPLTNQDKLPPTNETTPKPLPGTDPGRIPGLPDENTRQKP